MANGAGRDVSVFEPAGVVRVNIFGSVRIWRGDHEVDAGPARQRTVLAELVCAAGNTVGLATLIDALWGDDSPASAINQVHRIVGQLRRTLEPGLSPHSSGTLILAAGTGYRIAAEHLECDLYQFRDLVQRADFEALEDNCAGARDLYADALGLAQRSILGGLDPSIATRSEFVAIEQERVTAAISAANLAIKRGCSPQTLAAVVAIAVSAPLHEPLHAYLIRLLASAGRRAEALVTYDAMRRRLADELGVNPGPELAQVYQEILASDVDQLPLPVEAPAMLLAATTASPLPAQLPRALPGFVHRPETELLLDEDLADAGATIVITALGGMGGIGKTALAVQLAYQRIKDFPDGQLYLNLRGFSPESQVVEPGDAVNSLLEALGQSVADMTGATVEERSARYRSLMAGRRMVIVLDNARDSEQVRPLLPGSPQCLVLITSRNRLASLVAREGARFVPLGRLAPPEARQLLVNRLGQDRVAAEPDAVSEIITACAGLPLALSIVAARIATNPELPMSRLVSSLFGVSPGLDALTTGEGRDDVRSVFSWSYEALSPDGARLFRLIGAHPGPDFSLTLLANLLGVDTMSTRRIADELVSAHMLTASDVDRYVLHDLLRVYAGELLDASDGRGDAELRIVDHYLLATRAAYSVYGREPIAELQTIHSDLVVEDCGSTDQALVWYVRERVSLEGAVNLAVARNLPRSAALLVLDRRPMNQSLDPPPASLPQAMRVLDAAGGTRGRDAVEPLIVAELHRDVADRWMRQGGPDGDANSDRHFQAALSIFGDANDDAGQSNTYRSLSQQAYLRGDERYLDYAHEALRFARLARRDDLIARTIMHLAECLYEASQHREAVDVATEALEIITAMNLEYLEPVLRMVLARGLLQLGKPAESLVHARDGLEQVTDAGEALGARHAQRAGAEFLLLAAACEAAMLCDELDLAAGFAQRFKQLDQSAEGVFDGIGAAEVSELRGTVSSVLAATEGTRR